MLEKMYARIFDTSPAAKGNKMPEVTEEGMILLTRANILPQDLYPKTLDDFLRQEMAA